MAKFAVILPAAGRSSRFQDKHYKKPFAPLGRRAVWLHSAERFLGRDDVVQLILIISPNDRDDFNFKFSSNVAILGIDVVDGGAERDDSVAAALERLKPEADFVCVHDAARPCLADAWIDKIFAAAEKTGAAIFAVPVAGALPSGSPVTLGVRPEHITVTSTGPVAGEVLVVERLGGVTYLHVRIEGGALLTVQADGESAVRMHDVVRLAFNAEHAHVFDEKGLALVRVNRHPLADQRTRAPAPANA